MITANLGDSVLLMCRLSVLKAWPRKIAVAPIAASCARLSHLLAASKFSAILSIATFSAAID